MGHVWQSWSGSKLMSALFRASLLISIFFAVNKLIALLRQVIIARQFGLSESIDAFNVANNYPDLIVSLISAGALSFAFIPVLSEYKTLVGLKKSWQLFSQIANLVLLVTIGLSVLIALFAEQLVRASWGIAPGFNPAQQALVVDLMRLNLLATIIFSISGMIMASLHTHKHFLLPAIAPILYNVGQIFGAFVLAPTMGVYGLGVGVIIGALLHLLIQIPALFKFEFSWLPILNFRDKYVLKVFSLMGPRILTVFLINFIFVARDNLASRLEVGAVSALTYAYFIMQVPQTLIGTAIGTALLPTLSEITDKKELFEATLNRIIRVMIAITLIITLLLSLGLTELVKVVFNFSEAQSNLLTWTTIAYMIGLLGHCLLEVVSRGFYAKQDAKIPLVATVLRAVIFIVLALIMFESYGVVGLALADSISVSIEVLLLFVLLGRNFPGIYKIGDTIMRTILGCVAAGVVMFILSQYIPGPPLITTILGLIISSLVYLLFIKKELKILVKI
jgi:putative peptidoglycan lipid II flippase